MDKRYFSEKIVKWYENNKRDLPWRATKDPYKIWLSEIILQQTRVAQGLPYYQTFIKRYPTVRKLATASEQEVLRTWQGLGYYTRARNLHKCAKVVSEKFNGAFPVTYADLLDLPGIGEYTAAAISSFANKEVVPVVDGNVFRVLARVFGIETPINSLKAKLLFQSLAKELISTEFPDIHNQAVMEFGALQCVPKKPNCDSCILKKSCFAFNRNLVDKLPVKLKSKPSKKRYFNYLVAECDGKLSMKRRPETDIWGGLYDFHLVETARPMNSNKILIKHGLGTIKDSIEVSKTYKHVLTHQTIFSKFIIVKGKSGKAISKSSKFYSLNQVNSLPKPVLISRFLADYYVS